MKEINANIILGLIHTDAAVNSISRQRRWCRMKRIIILICAAVLCVALGCLICNQVGNRNSPETDQQDSTERLEDLTDKRVREALASNRKYIMEEDGIDVPFSTDLLQTVAAHFGTTMVDIGAGLYRGKVSDNIEIELLRNSKGNVGQVQACSATAATDEELQAMIVLYSKFVNPDLDEQTYLIIANEVLQMIRGSVSNEPCFYFNHGLGYGLKIENNMIIMFLP